MVGNQSKMTPAQVPLKPLVRLSWKILSRGTIYNIIHEHLKLCKVVARWVPHELTDKNRRKRVEDCRENLKMFREGKWRLCYVVTGDESWFFYRQIGRKQDNATWIGEGENAKPVVRRIISG